MTQRPSTTWSTSVYIANNPEPVHFKSRLPENLASETLLIMREMVQYCSHKVKNECLTEYEHDLRYTALGSWYIRVGLGLRPDECDTIALSIETVYTHLERFVPFERVESPFLRRNPRFRGFAVLYHYAAKRVCVLCEGAREPQVRLLFLLGFFGVCKTGTISERRHGGCVIKDYWLRWTIDLGRP